MISDVNSTLNTKSETTGVRRIDGVGLTPEHYLGASNEYLAASYFLRNGYQVFFPAVQQGWIDFVIYDGEKFQKVQVKTATWNRSSGAHWYLQCRVRFHAKYDDVLPSAAYDILCVLHEEGIWVIPSHEVDYTSNLCLMSNNPNYRPRGKDFSIFRDQPPAADHRGHLFH